MFEEFWAKYPRKVAKKDAKKMWDRLSDAQQKKALETIPAHARRWSDLHFIPHAASWLNGERFDDELPEQYNTSPDWFKTDQGTLAYGNQKGLRPRPGESMGDYRARLKAA